MGGSHAIFSDPWIADGGHLLRGGGLSGAARGTGVRGGDPDRDHRGGSDKRTRQEGRSGTERHHPVDRRLLRSCGGGRYIHTSCHLHSWS